MKITQQQRGQARVLAPDGPVTGADSDALAKRLEDALQAETKTIIFDATKVSLLDSRALEALLDATEQLIRTGHSLKIAGANETVREVLEITELAPLFEQFDDLNAAMEALV